MKAKDLIILPLLFVLIFPATPLRAQEDNGTDWRAEAEARIQEHRTSDITLKLVDTNGRALPAGTPVRVQMTRSAFNWGTAIASWKFDRFGPDHIYFTKIPELFNTVTLTNGLKWRPSLDPEKRPLSEKTMEWAQEQGLAIRGHTFFWGVVKHPVLPKKYQEAIINEEPGLEEELLEAALAHIEELGQATPFIYEWDVVNEPVNEPKAWHYMGAKTVEEQAEIIGKMFAAAEKAAPQATLAINEYHIFAQPRAHKRFLALAQALKENGAPIVAAGFQNHYFSGGMQATPEEIYNRLSEYADLGLTLSVTEWDCFGGGWGDDPEQAKADYLETFLTIFYSHPAARDFVMWGYWDGQHWKNDGPLFQEDWTPKPALEVWEKLVLGEWRTDENLQAAADGTVSLRAHHGQYVARVRIDETEFTGEFTVEAESDDLTVTLTAQEERE